MGRGAEAEWGTLQGDIFLNILSPTVVKGSV